MPQATNPKDRRRLPLSDIGWICRVCWQSGESSIRAIAEKQHSDIHANQKRAHNYEYRACDSPNIVMRSELSKVEFEGLVGEKMRFDFDSATPIQF